MGQKHYSNNELNQAINEYGNGTKIKIVCDRFHHIPRRKIIRGALVKRQDISKNRPVPDPVLSFEMESDLVDWVIGMKSQRYLVTWDMILLKVNEIYRGLYGPTWSAGYLKGVWLNRFMNWHPLLTTRTSQVIKSVRAEATEEGLKIFTWEFMNNLTEQK